MRGLALTRMPVSATLYKGLQAKQQIWLLIQISRKTGCTFEEIGRKGVKGNGSKSGLSIEY